MQGWRLQLKRKNGLEEIINLDSSPKVFVGDDTANEICIASIQIPARLKMIESKKDFVRIRLTDDVIPSFKGQAGNRKRWKNPLYTGEIIDVVDTASWKVEDIEFKLFREAPIALSPFTKEVNPLERKHFWQSIGMSAATHALLILVLIIGGFVLRQFEDKPEIDVLAKAEKVSIQEVKEIFKPKEVVVVTEEVPASVEPEPVKEEPKVEPEPKKTASAKASNTRGKKNRALSAATGRSTTPGKPNVNNMGLLAVASARTGDARSLSVDAPRVLTPDPNAKTNGIGMNPLGQGVRSGIQTQQVAQLNGVSVGGYESGSISKQITATKGPGVQLVRKEIEIRGGLDPAIIQQIVQERLAEVRYCYENALLSDVNLGGKVSTSWTIRADGSVSELEAMSDEPRMQKIYGCIKERIGRWKFPEPKGGGVVHVKYPFVFSSFGS